MKKVSSFFLWFLCLAFFGYTLVFAEGESNPEKEQCLAYKSGNASSSYGWQIKQCVETDPTKRSTIQDYICIPGSAQVAAYQAVTDLVLQKIDTDIEKEIKKIAETKGESSFEKTTKLQEKLAFDGLFASRYNYACTCVIRNELISYFGSISTQDWTEKFMQGGISCETLTSQKLAAYKRGGDLMIRRETVDEYQKGTRAFMQPFFERFGILINEVLRTLVDGINKLLSTLDQCTKRVIWG